MRSRPFGHLHRDPLREPVPALLGAADRVGEQHPRAFEAGWGGVVTKTIGMHPVVNVAGPKTKFLRYHPETGRPLDEQGPRRACSIPRGTGSSSPTSRSTGGSRASSASRRPFPNRVLIASIMAGSGNDKELDHWRTLAHACQDAGRRRPRAEPLLPAHGSRGHGLEHRQGPGALLVRHPGREGSGARAGLGQAHARDRATSSSRPAPSSAAAAMPSCSSNTFPSLPLIDPETLEFEMNVDGLRVERRPRRPRHPAAVAGEMSQMTRAFPSRASRASAASPTSATPSTTSCSAAARCRSARRPCSTTPWARTSSSASRRLAGVPREARRPRLEGIRRLPRPRPRPRRLPRPDPPPESADYRGGYEQEGTRSSSEPVVLRCSSSVLALNQQRLRPPLSATREAQRLGVGPQAH